MRYLPLYIVLISIAFLHQACTPEIDQEDLIESAVEIKLGQYRANQLKQCRERALVDAEDYVDSLLVAISLDRKLDTIPKPKRPDKPVQPEFKTKPDSVVVDKIYKDQQ